MSDYANFSQQEMPSDGIEQMHTSIDDQMFFKRGTIEVHFQAARGNDTQLNRIEAAALTRAANRVDVLKTNFLDGITPIFRKRVGEDGIIQIMTPSSPYAYGGVMVVAASRSLLDADNATPDKVVQTETAFDLTPEMRQEYYRQILSGIKAEEDTLLPDRDNGKVIAYENTVPSISNENYRLPRTIALPHMHIVKGGDWVNENILPLRPHGFSLEQEIAQDERLLQKFRNRWFNPYSSSQFMAESEILSLKMRSRAPYGYTMTSKIARDSTLEAQAEALSNLLVSHHAAYSDFATQQAQTVDQARTQRRYEFTKRVGIILPQLSSVSEKLPLQPSYRTYLYYTNGFLNATISPIITTTLGAMEGMETAVNRGLHHEKAFTDQQMALFFKCLSIRLHTLLDNVSAPDC
jgi:hypothetical protein